MIYESFDFFIVIFKFHVSKFCGAKVYKNYQS